MWTVEISEYLQIYLVFLSAAWVLRNKGHVILDVVLERLGPRLKKGLTLFRCSLGILVTAFLAIFAGIVTYEQMALGIPVIKTIEIPKWMIIAPIPVGMTMLCVEFIVQFLVNVRKGNN